MSNLKTGIVHGVVSGLLFLLPILIAHLGGYADITVGAILNAIYHAVVAKYA